MNQPNLIQPPDLSSQPLTVGRYILHRQIARGGMATIHIARLMGDEGFSRIVAAKRLHPEFAEDAEFVAMFLDEARVASRVHHRNVVPVLDVVTAGEEVILVQEYVHGAPLQWLLRCTQQEKAGIPVNVAVSIGCQVLAGLHATHETVDEMGVPMEIVHRDVSPQNVMVAMDGSARLLDFGVAKAVMAAHVTREGTYKGKLAYSAPEHIRGAATRQSDVYSLSVLLWELLVGQRMHRTKSGAELVATVMSGALPTMREALTAEGVWDTISAADRRQLQLLDPIVRRGLALNLGERWATAADMEEALIAVARPASERVVAAWLGSVGKDFLEKREGLIAAEEASWRRVHPVGSGRSSASLSVPRNSSIQLRVPGADSVAQVSFEASGMRPKPRGRTALLCVAAAGLALGSLFAFSSLRASNTTQLARTPSVVPGGAPPSTTVTRASRAEPVPGRALASKAEAAPRIVETPHAAAAPRAPTEAKDKVQVRRPRPGAPRAASESAAPSAASPTREASPPAAPADDCSTPYYFDGSKKIFKPACI